LSGDFGSLIWVKYMLEFIIQVALCFSSAIESANVSHKQVELTN